MSSCSERLLPWVRVLGLLGSTVLAAPSSAPAESPSSPANVMFLLDNNEDMQRFSYVLPEDYTPGHYPPSSSRKGDLGFNDPRYGHFFNTGCSDPLLLQAMSWFAKDSHDPWKNGTVAQDSDSELGAPFFSSTQFYHSRGWRLAWAPVELPHSLSADFKLVSTPDPVFHCRQVWNNDSQYINTPIMNECVSCLRTRGWWRGPLVPASGSNQTGYLGPPQRADEPPLPPSARRKWIVAGGVLNLNPPRFVVARKVLKDILQTTSQTRMGVATPGSGYTWFDPAVIVNDLQPSCAKSIPFFQEAAFDRSSLVKSVNRVRFDNPKRPLGEALFSLGGYFSSEKIDGRWSSWFAQPVGTYAWGWPGAPRGGTIDNPYTGQSGADFARAREEWIKPAFTDSRGVLLPGQRFEPGKGMWSICSRDQANAIIVVTAGPPRWDNVVPITKMLELLVEQGARHDNGAPLTFDQVDPLPGNGVNYCHLFGGTQDDCDYTWYNWPHGMTRGNKNFMDDVAFFLAHSDLRGDLLGEQHVRTYLIGYNDNSPMLQSMAVAGRGTFARIDTPQSLRAALEWMLQNVNTSDSP